MADYSAGSSHTDAAQQDTDHQPILNNGDQAQLESFFDNPDEASTNHLLFDQAFGMDGKVDNSELGAASNYNHSSGTIVDPTTTFAPTLGGSYQTHMQGQQLPQMGPANGVFGHTAPLLDDESQDMFVANLLTGMSSHGASGSGHPLAGDPFAHGSWGRLATYGSSMARDSPQSSLTSSGRQSSAGIYPHQLPIQGFRRNQQQLRQPSVQPSVAHAQQQQLHSRHPSLSLDTMATAYPWNQPFPQPRPSFSASHAQIHPPPSLSHTYGSDPSFGARGFYGNSFMFQQSQDKAANLTNVPFAHQAAANGASYPHDPTKQLRPHGLPSVPTARPKLNSQASSPGSVGGLPLSSPASATQQQRTYSRTNSRVRPALPAQDHDEVSEKQPRKRRKSQMERDDEAEYLPDMPTESNVASRSAKVRNSRESSDDERPAPPPNTAAAKRRRSGGTARSPPDSNVSESPTAEGSSGRRKRGDGKARQNLTDKEKRQNHIFSEQKRRNMIKECFSDLENMVPSLAGGKAGFSKSEALKEVALMIENTLTGNKTVMDGLGLTEIDLVGSDADEKYEAEPQGVGIFG